VNGQNFSADAQVLWNGVPVPTTFVNAGRVTAQIGPSLLADGQTVGIAVRNVTPQEQISQPVFFEVEVGNHAIYLPAVLR
jgi:hypothetical protein